jgi:hypothetical protein
MDLTAVKSQIIKIPGVTTAFVFLQTLKNFQNPFLRSVPPGHFYSPIPDITYIRKHRGDIFARDKTPCPGIEISEQKQLDLIKDLASYYSQMPFSEERREGFRYYFRNDFFGHGSAIILYTLMRHFRPNKIVEVGSGFSSAAMLDVNDLFFDGHIQFTFIEPYPERLHALLTKRDRERHNIFPDIAQHVPYSVYTDLEVNDILFIDSSHVAKVGSDVVLLLTDILPILRKGVIIHIHDIYWPFEYPEDWVLSGTAFNEAYLVKAFLQFNNAFEILLFNSYLAIYHQMLLKKCLPLFLPNGGSSLWLRKTT